MPTCLTSSLTAPRARRLPGSARRTTAAVIAALCVLSLLAFAAPAIASQSTLFTISGRGWGHGIGMSQWGAYGYAKHGWTYKAILKHYYTGIAFGNVPDDAIRVRLAAGQTSVKVTCAKPYTAAMTGVTVDIPADTTATVTWAGGAYRVSFNDPADDAVVTKDFSAPPTFTPSAGSMRYLGKTENGVTDGLFRGVIRVFRPDSSFLVVNKLPLESYLRGVVPHEVSPSWPVESLKAQACAARAYAARAMKQAASSGQLFDVYSTVRSQAYDGVSREDPRTDAALSATAGVVPTYDGAVIAAFYFSTSGGHTENIENSWQTSPLPYLKGVVDAYDSYSPLHIWTPETRSDVALGSKLGGSVSGTLRAIYVVQRGVSPRIVKAAVIGSKGVQFLHGSILRAKLGLKDSWAFFRSMSISPAAADKARIAAGASVTLKGRLYKAAPAGATVALHSYYNGAWHTRRVPTNVVKVDLGSGSSARYSSYSITLKPAVTTRYYFTYGDVATSPKTTVTVVPSTPSPTPTPSPSGSSAAPAVVAPAQ